MKDTVGVIKAKIMLAVITSLKNSKYDRLSQNTELLKHYKTLSQNSNLFLNMTNSYWPLISYKFWRPFSYRDTKTLSLKEALYSWQKLQQTHPSLFKGLDDKYFINNGDLKVIQNLDDLESFSGIDDNIALKLKKIRQNIEDKKAYNIKSKDIQDLESEIALAQKKLYSNIKNSYSKYIKKFSSLCENDNDLFLSRVNRCNRVVNSGSSIEQKLNAFSDIFNTFYVKDAKKPTLPKKPSKNVLSDLRIKKVKYKTNPNKKAEYCIRDKKALSAIAIHHTGTDSSKTPSQLNQFHLNRSSKGDPWYMIGYHYLISSSTSEISEGRPLEYRGAHAGGYENSPSKNEFNRIKDLKMTCAHDKNAHKGQKPYSITEDFKNGRPHGNITSVGIALVGNYETKYKSSVSGVKFINNSAKVIPRLSNKTITKTAKLSCKLQKENPTIRVIRPHSYYKATNCPGSIIADLKAIAQKAELYGCSFKVEFVK